MKKYFLILLVTLCNIYNGFSQTATPANKAKTILDNVSAKTKSYSTIKITYTFIQEQKEQEAEKTSGTLLLKGNKYQLSLLGNILYCDGVTLWTMMTEEKEVTVATLESQKGDGFNPAKMLTIYETGFKYKFIQERFEQSRAIYIIDLFPKEVEKSEYSRVRLYIDKDKSQIWKLEYFSKDGNKYTIIVNSFTPNIALADTEFKFDKTKNPGVKIIDER